MTLILKYSYRYSVEVRYSIYLVISKNFSQDWAIQIFVQQCCWFIFYNIFKRSRQWRWFTTIKSKAVTRLWKSLQGGELSRYLDKLHFLVSLTSHEKKEDAGEEMVNICYNVYDNWTKFISWIFNNIKCDYKRIKSMTCSVITINAGKLLRYKNRMCCYWK